MHRWRQLAPPAIAALVSLLPALGTLASGCADGPADGARRAITPDRSSPSDQSGSEAGGKTKKKLDVRTLEVQTTAACRALERNFSGFLDRRPIGLAADEIPSELSRRLQASIRWLRRAPTRLVDADPTSVLTGALPPLIVALFLFAFAAIDRSFSRLAHRIQTRIHLPSSPTGTRLFRGSILVTARLAAVGLLLGASYFPVRALFPEASWASALSELLWFGIGYRALVDGLAVVISGRVVDIDPAHADDLETAGRWAARVLFGYLALLAILDSFLPSSELSSLVRLAFWLTLAALPLFFIRIREALVDLVDSDVDSSLYDFLHGALARHFRTAMVATSGMLVLRAVGFVPAASYFLVRGWSVYALLLFAAFGTARLRSSVFRRVQFFETDVDGRPLSSAESGKLSDRAEQLTLVAIGVAVTAAALSLLKLLGPIVLLVAGVSAWLAS
ncbi:MAG: hypothetical protein ABEL76_15850, partial [Bradymonadaceae bacterium]